MGDDTPAPQQTVQRQEPPSFAIPGLTRAAGQAETLFEAGPQQFFPGSTVVPFAPETEEALTLTAERARAGSPLVGAAQQTALETLQGRGVSPFLAGATQAATAPIFEQFTQETLPDIRSAFAGISRGGSGAEERALQRAITGFGRAVGEPAARLSLGAAEAESQRQFGALPLAAGLAEQDFAGAQRLGQVGATRQALEQAQLQEEISRFQFGQQSESQRLNQLISQLQGTVAPGFGTTTQFATAVQPNRFLTGLGGAATGAQIGAIGGPFGLGIGALLGGLAGGFG